MMKEGNNNIESLFPHSNKTNRKYKKPPPKSPAANKQEKQNNFLLSILKNGNRRKILCSPQFDTASNFSPTNHKW